MKKVTIGLTLLAIGLIIFAIRLMAGGNAKTNDETDASIQIPASYTSFMHQQDARKYQTTLSIEYEVQKMSSSQINLVARVNQEWHATIIDFDPSSKIPFVAEFEKVEREVYSTALMKFTPNRNGGFDYVFLEEGKDPIEGVMRPNW